MDQMNAAALLAFPVLLFGAYLIDQSHTVVLTSFVVGVHDATRS